MVVSSLLKGERLCRCGRLRSRAVAGSGSWSRQWPGSRSAALQRGLEGGLHPLHGARSSCRAFLQRQRGLSEDCPCSSRVPWRKGKTTSYSVNRPTYQTIYRCPSSSCTWEGTPPSSARSSPHILIWWYGCTYLVALFCTILTVLPKQLVVYSTPTVSPVTRLCQHTLP